MENITKLVQEMDELTDIIREYDAENAEFENLFYLCCAACAEVDEIRNEIKVLLRNQNRPQSIQKATISSSDFSEMSYDDECIYSTMKEEICKLRMEMILKNKKIRALELQMRSRNIFHKIFKERLQQLGDIWGTYSNKISKLKAEIEQLKMAMLRTKAKECEDEMTNQIEKGESNQDEECNSIPSKKEIKEEIQEIRNKLLLSLNL